MKRLLSLLLLFSLLSGLLMFTVACGERPDGGADEGPDDPGEPGNGDPGDDPDDEPDTPPAGLALVQGGEAKFQFVYSSRVGSEVMSAINECIAVFAEYGIAVEKREDYRVDYMQDCEILVGASLSGRTDYAVDVHTVGLEGYILEARDEKLTVAGGSDASTAEGLRFLAAHYLFAGEETDGALADCSVPSDFRLEKQTEYDIPDVTVAGQSMKENFRLVIPDRQPYVSEAATRLQSTLYSRAGVWLDIVAAPVAGTHSVFVQGVEDCGKDGFAVYEKNGDLYIECAYLNSFEKGVGAFLNRFVNTAMEEVAFGSDFSYSYCVSIVRYTDFGVVGDGVTDDLDAIRAAHIFANECGQKVCAYAASDETKGADLTFYVGYHDYQVSVRTDTDWGNARFVIDDRNIDVSHRGYNIFRVDSDYAAQSVDISGFESIKVGATNIGMTFDHPYMLYLNWSGNKVYIRYGGNANSGSNQQEIILVDEEGNIDPTTPILWDYGGMDSITAYRIDDKPLTVEGGIFTTRANCAVSASNYYARGIQVSRSNTTLYNIKHYITDEGANGCPYTGFFCVQNANNVEINACVMTGHKTYTNIKPSTGAKVSQGTYDTTSNRSNDVRWVNCTQSQGVDTDAFTNQSVCWGVMASNFCKNLLMDGCTLSRFDAHQGMWNATVKNSTIGIAINCIGGGTLLIENTVRYSGSSFISLRQDYGSIWDGDVIIRNCTLRATSSVSYLVNASYVTVNKDGKTTGHWFGYRCCMPHTVTVENFKVDTSKASTTLYVFNSITSQTYDISKDTVNPYAYPTAVTVSSTYPVRLTNSANPFIKAIPHTITIL